MAAGQDSRAEVSRTARERLRDALRDQLDEVQVRLQEAILRADAHLLTGNSQGAAQALEDQRQLLGDLESRLDSVLSDALVEREAEAVVADAATRLDRSSEGQPSVGTATTTRADAPSPTGSAGRSGSRGDPVGASTSRVPVPTTTSDGSGRQLSAMLSAVMTIVAAVTLALGGLTGIDSDLGTRSATLSSGTTAGVGASGTAGAVGLPVGSVEATSGRADVATSEADDGSWADRGYLGPTATEIPREDATAGPAGPTATDHLPDAGEPELPAMSGVTMTASSDVGTARPLGIRELVSGLLGDADESGGAGDEADAGSTHAEGTEGAGEDDASGDERARDAAGSDESPEESDSDGLVGKTVPDLLPGADSGDEQTGSSESTDDSSRDGLRGLLGEDGAGSAPAPSPPVGGGL